MSYAFPVVMFVLFICIAFGAIFLKKLQSDSLFRRGYEFSVKQLSEGVSVEALEILANDRFDFSDFERGMLQALREAQS